MHGLNNLITSGKVLYLGISDTPAWLVVKANDYAKANGLRPFSVYQGKWNAGFRDMEREIIPMCRDQGMAICPWAPLGQGKFKSADARKSGEKGSARSSDLSENDIKISDALESIAKKKNTNLHAIVSQYPSILFSTFTNPVSQALAYVMHKTPYVHPIVGQRSVKHLKSNIEALSVSLSDEDLKAIDGAAPFDIGFPMNFIFREYNSTVTASDVMLTRTTALIDVPPNPAPTRSHNKDDIA